MYDTCFDAGSDALPPRDRHILWSSRIVALALTMLAGWAEAQMPGVPVLQNVWAMPGVVGAFNLGGGSGGSIYAGAGSWTPTSGRFQLSGGVGMQARSAGGGSSWSYGARVALPLASATGDIGFGAFAGIGGRNARRSSATDTTTADTTATTTTTQIPVGVAVGWRHAIGATRGFSVYTSPSFVWLSGGSRTGGVLRVAAGADVGITESIGVTGGIELGQTRSTGGRSGTLYGLGVSYAFGRR